MAYKASSGKSGYSGKGSSGRSAYSLGRAKRGGNKAYKGAKSQKGNRGYNNKPQRYALPFPSTNPLYGLPVGSNRSMGYNLPPSKNTYASIPYSSKGKSKGKAPNLDSKSNSAYKTNPKKDLDDRLTDEDTERMANNVAYDIMVMATRVTYNPNIANADPETGERMYNGPMVVPLSVVPGFYSNPFEYMGMPDELEEDYDPIDEESLLEKLVEMTKKN